MITMTQGSIAHHFILRAWLWKGGSAMDVKVTIDYKVVLALGVVAVGTIFALRMEPNAIKEVSIYAIGAARNHAIAIPSAC